MEFKFRESKIQRTSVGLRLNEAYMMKLRQVAVNENVSFGVAAEILIEGAIDDYFAQKGQRENKTPRL